MFGERYSNDRLDCRNQRIFRVMSCLVFEQVPYTPNFQVWVCARLQNNDVLWDKGDVDGNLKVGMKLLTGKQCDRQ